MERPAWAARPFRQFLAYAGESRRIMHMSETGIRMLRAVPKAVDALAVLLTKEESESQEHIDEVERAAEIASFAEAECARGFPLLHAHHLVGLWGALEAAFEDVQIAFLLNDPRALTAEPFTRIKIPLAEFESTEREDRMRILSREFQRMVGLERRQGCERFEALLEPLGLSGRVTPECKRLIYEMQQVRNVLVHRGGISDRRLVEACPWMNLKVGDPVLVTWSGLSSYESALTEYITEVTCRIGKRFGIDMSSVTRKTNEEGI